ncbi:MAG: hypothetical protein WKG07_07945 [Hymenobacter sp.]
MRCCNSRDAPGRHAEWSDLLSDTIGAALVLMLPSPRRRPLALAAALLLALALPSAPSLLSPTRPAPATPSKYWLLKRCTAAATCSSGEHRAAAYLRGRLQELLQPLAPDYTQPFTLDVNTFPGKMSLKLTLSKLAPAAITPREVTLRPGLDFIAAPRVSFGWGPNLLLKLS